MSEITEDSFSSAPCFNFSESVFSTASDVEKQLFSAVRQKDVDLLIELMTSQDGGPVDLNCRDSEGHTCLGIACMLGFIPIIKALLQKGADINQTDFYGQTPLQYATEYGQAEVIKFLVKEGADVNFIEERLAAVHIAACKGLAEITRLLIQAKCDVNLLNRKGIAPLHCSVANGHREVTRILLQADACVNVKGQRSDRTPLFMAGEMGDLESAEMLIQRGARLNIVDRYGMTPLNVVCNRNCSSVAKLLIQAGSKVNLADKSGTLPIHYASRNGDAGVVQLLLDAGSKVDVLNKNSESPLHLAVRMQHTSIVQKLVESGCSANLFDSGNSTGVSPLYAAVSVYSDPTEFEEILNLLISANSFINEKIKTTNETPLYRALDLNKVGIATVLLQHGADPFVTCPHETTILCKSCQRNMTSFVEMLTASTTRWHSEPWLASSFNTTNLSSRNLGHFGEVPVDVPMVFWNKQSLYRRIQEIRSNPMSLQNWCRLVIREQLSDKLQEKINKLLLPSSVKLFLMMKTDF